MRVAIALVQDFELFTALQKVLKEQGVILKSAQTADGVVEFLASEKNPLLFLDLRSSQVDQEVLNLLERLANCELPAIDLVTVALNGFPKSCAASANLLSTSVVALRHDGAFQTMRGEPLEDLLTHSKASPIPYLRTMEGQQISISSREPKYFQALEDLKRIAHRNVTILIVGETGTGKTTLARIIHDRSPRRDRSFQHLACGALPSDIIESELFGHTRGAFTGADRNKIGRFQAAGQGTLLLDEIDVLDVKQQAKLLKVIETGEYEMVGSTEPRQSEARLIVASNVNLEQLADSSNFRPDLYYRLSVLEFRLLPLRERRIDIIPLAMQFINECCAEHEIDVRSIDFDFLDVLQGYHWPGNIRELKNHIRRAVLFCESGRLTVNDLSPKLIHSQFEPEATTKVSRPKTSLADQVAKSEHDLLIEALTANDNNRTRTAKALGISRVGLYKKLRKHGLVEHQVADVT